MDAHEKPSPEDGKIHVDADWKAEAQAEKEKLSQEAEANEAEGGAGAGQVPPASFETLLSTITTQALLYILT